MAIPITEEPAPALLMFALGWFEALGQGNVAVALAMLDLPTSYGTFWSESSLAQVLAEHDGLALSSITPPSSMASLPPHVSLGEFSDGTGYWLDCDVPIGGAWSDLTAQFEFTREGNRFAVALQDLHVL